MYTEQRSDDFMLIQFKFKNHKCFCDETVLDLTATQEKRHSENLININGNKLLPLVAIHGANASGKTTIIDALIFMFTTVKEALKIDVNQDLKTNPFIFSEKSREQNSEYEVSININDYEYRYGFSINNNEFVEEWLYKKKFTASSRAAEKVVFERQKSDVFFNKEYLKYEKIWNFYKNEISSKKLLILSHIAVKEETGFLRDLYDYMSNFKATIDNIREQQQISINILHKNSKLFDKFQEIINEFDPCLLGVKIEPSEDENGKNKFKISGVHKTIDNKENTFIPFHNESFGTIKLFNILPLILISLETGSLLCIDELDVKFHPLLFKKIVNMYNDKSINEKNAQLIFTAHSTFLFNSNDMRRDQLYLVEKNEYGQSKLYSLSEFRNLRVDSDYEKKYLTGQFGAIPFENE